MDSAVARQIRAEKNLALVEVQLTAAQQKMEEAKAEMAAADKVVDEARQLAVQTPRFFCRCGNTGASSATSTSAADPQHSYSRSSDENDRRDSEHEESAASAAAETSASHANDADDQPRIGAFPKITSYAGS